MPFARRSLPLLVLCLSVGSTPALAQVSTPAAESGAREVAEVREIEVDGRPIALSPDGAWLFGEGSDDDVCIWDIETLEPACDGLVPGILDRSVQWAPDSSAVAFSIDAPRFLRDSDMLVFEVESGTLENLTDEPGAGNEFDSLGFDDDDPLQTVDLYSSWSPDSQHLVFARTDWGGGQVKGTDLMTIARDGGDPEWLVRLTPPEPFVVNGPMFWGDDDAILFSFARRDLDDRQNGIYRLPLDGRIEQVLSARERDGLPYAMIGSVSGDGSRASIVSLGNLALYAFEPGMIHVSADLTTGDTHPWESEFGLATDPAEAVAGGELLAASPAFGAGSDDIVFLTRVGDTVTVSLHIAVTGETVALTDLEQSPGLQTFERGADWAVNDTIFLTAGEGPSMLLILEPTET